MPRGVLRGVLLRGVRRGVVLRPFAMVSREEVDGKAAAREKKVAARGSFGVRSFRFPVFVFDETRRRSIPQPRGTPENSPKGPHTNITRSAAIYSEHGESVLRKVDFSSPEATACKRAAHGAGME